MISELRFYRSTDAYRVVKQLTPRAFVVVKLMRNNAWTAKFWFGSIEATESAWRTKRFVPDPALESRLTFEFEMILAQVTELCNLSQAP